MILIDKTSLFCAYCKRKMTCTDLEYQESAFCRKCAKKRLAEAKAQREPQEWIREGAFFRLIPTQQEPV